MPTNIQCDKQATHIRMHNLVFIYIGPLHRSRPATCHFFSNSRHSTKVLVTRIISFLDAAINPHLIKWTSLVLAKDAQAFLPQSIKFSQAVQRNFFPNWLSWFCSPWTHLTSATHIPLDLGHISWIRHFPTQLSGSTISLHDNDIDCLNHFWPSWGYICFSVDISNTLCSSSSVLQVYNYGRPQDFTTYLV